MNRRQKKKRFKKIHGYNPPKCSGGKSVYNAEVGIDMAAGKDVTVTLTSEQIRALEEIVRMRREQFTKAQNSLRTVADVIRNGMSRVTESLSKTLKEFALALKKEQKQEPCVVVAKSLAERRKKGCRKRQKW